MSASDVDLPALLDKVAVQMDEDSRLTTEEKDALQGLARLLRSDDMAGLPDALFAANRLNTLKRVTWSDPMHLSRLQVEDLRTIQKWGRSDG